MCIENKGVDWVVTGIASWQTNIMCVCVSSHREDWNVVLYVSTDNWCADLMKDYRWHAQWLSELRKSCAPSSSLSCLGVSDPVQDKSSQLEIEMDTIHGHDALCISFIGLQVSCIPRHITDLPTPWPHKEEPDWQNLNFSQKNY